MSFTPIPDGSGPGGVFVDGDFWTPAIGNIVRDDFNDHETRIASLYSTNGSVLLATRTAASSNDLTFTSVLSSEYNEYEFVLDALTPATNVVEMRMVWSSNNGSSWYASNYAFSGVHYRSGGVFPGGSASIAYIPITNQGFFSNDAARGGFSGTMRMFNVNSSSQYKRMTGQFWFAASDNSFYGVNISGAWLDTPAINAVQFAFNSGAIVSGTIKCYGIKK